MPVPIEVSTCRCDSRASLADQILVHMKRTGIIVICIFGLGVALWCGLMVGNGERKGILAPFDLTSGHYVILFSIGEPDLRGAEPSPERVRVVDNQALIAKYRNQIDMTHGFADFLPGEGRPMDIFLYVYRDGIRVAGGRITDADRIAIPPQVMAASRVMAVSGLSDASDAIPQLTPVQPAH